MLLKDWIRRQIKKNQRIDPLKKEEGKVAEIILPQKAKPQEDPGLRIRIRMI